MRTSSPAPGVITPMFSFAPRPARTVEEAGAAAATAPSHNGEPPHSDACSTIIEELTATSSAFQYLAAAICGLCNASDAVEVLSLSFILKNIPGMSTEEQGVLSASVFAGMLVGGLAAGFAGDAWGRKPVLIFSLAVNAAFGALSGALPYWQWLAACRVVAGVGVGGSIPTLFTLFVEYLPVANRGFFISLVAWFWMIGTILAAGTGWVMVGVFALSWRWVVVACALPAATAATLVATLLPESPRFFALRGQHGKAAASLRRMAAWNRTALVESEVVARLRSGGGYGTGGRAGAAAVDETDGKEEGEGNDAEGGVVASSLFAGGDRDRDGDSDTVPLSRAAWHPPAASDGGNVSGGYTRLSFAATLREFFGPRLRRTSLLLIVVWSGLSFGWYGVNVWLPTLLADSGPQFNVYEDAFVAAAANLPGNIAAALLLDRLGRKVVLTASLVLACAATISFAFATSEAAAVAAACLMNAISVGSWNALDALTVELFPTQLRTSSVGILSAFGRLGSIGGQLVFGALVDKSIPAVLGIAGGMLLVAAVAAAALPRDPSGLALVEMGGGETGGGRRRGRSVPVRLVQPHTRVQVERKDGGGAPAAVEDGPGVAPLQWRVG